MQLEAQGLTDVPVIHGRLAVVTMVKCLPGSRSDGGASSRESIPRRNRRLSTIMRDDLPRDDSAVDAAYRLPHAARVEWL